MDLLSALIAALILTLLYAAWQGIIALRALGEHISGAEPPSVQIQIPETKPVPVADDPRIEALETKIHDLTLAVSDGIQRAHRSENRVRAIVTGARRELAEHGFEHAGVEAEAGELLEVDGKTGDDEPVPTVSEDLGNGSQAPSPIPGVTVGQMRRAWGMM